MGLDMNITKHRYDQGLIDRLYSRLDMSSEGGCWEWTGARNRQGYGRISFRGKMVSTHRVMYEIEYGTVPSTQAIDHIACSNKACANPAHLRACTWSENLHHRPSASSNKSGLRNVYLNPKPGLAKPWQVLLTVRGKRVFSAYFATKDEAAQAAHDARVKHLGWDGSDRAAA